MGAIENITDRIKKDAMKKAKQSFGEAKGQAKSLLSAANKELEKEKKIIELETEKTIKLTRSRAISEAKLEARKTMLMAKEEVITRAFSMARDRLSNLPPEHNERYLRNAISNASQLLGKDLNLLCNPKDAAAVTRISADIAPGSSVDSDNINYLGGVVIKAKDGTAQIDATFEGLLERRRNMLRKEVAEILFKSETEAKQVRTGQA